MSVKKVKAFLEQHGLADRLQEYAESAATVELAAKAVGCEPAMIAKTMAFTVNEKPVLIVLAGDVKIDNQKFKAYFKTKAKMMTPQQITAHTGFVVGGVSPFGVKDGVDIYLDESIKRFNTVYPAGGSPNSSVRVTVEELIRILGNPPWVDVSKAMSA